jgi:AraC-like DNA-binding protein
MRADRAADRVTVPDRAAHAGSTTLATWVKAICRALGAQGCDVPRLLAQAGLDPLILNEPTGRCPFEQGVALWRCAIEATGDEAFGLKVASYFKHTSFHALSYGIIASSTLKEAFERIRRYCHVVSDAVEYQLLRCGSEYHFVIHPADNVPFASVDAAVALHLRMCRSFVGHDYSPLRIELRRPRPAKVHEFETVLRAPLYFGCEQNRLVFDVESIERLLDTANPELARHNDAIALQYLARIERGNIQARVREVLMRRLECGEPSQEDVSAFLSMSARTLQRRLGESGTTYKEILDETRHALALTYLTAPENSLSDVTYLLGFSACSSFTRAFRRWTGLSPSAWRARGSRTPEPALFTVYGSLTGSC